MSEVLSGGYANALNVVRIGDTVRRPWRPQTEAIHALLEHLAAVGFVGAPRALGRDDQGREILSFVAGIAGVPPYEDWMLGRTALESAAQLLRAYHDAVVTFVPPLGATWAEVAPHAFRTAPIIAHNDANLDNVIFRDRIPVALIDFDLAGPADAVWDIATTVRHWAPLRDPCDIQDCRVGLSLERLRWFVDAYGLPRQERLRLVEAVLASHDWAYGFVVDRVAAGDQGFVQMWENGGRERETRTRQWRWSHMREMQDALLD